VAAKFNAVIVIPARQGSTRFPGKPAALIRGVSLLERTWRIAKAVPAVAEVYVATDDQGIRRQAEGFGAKALMTPAECRNGSERAFAAATQLKTKPDVVVNLQGDAVLTPPWVVAAAVAAMRKDAKLPVATPAVRLSWDQFDEFLAAKAGGRASGTMVVFDKKGDALYFSKAVIPFVRDRGQADPPIYRHIGLYAYRYEALKKYCSWPPAPIEEMEKLEQLRFLENGVAIRVVPVDYRGRRHWSVDNPEDIAIVEKIIAEEGELV
jgi:3-deoxy-manno-octulosonate cytidylyltransferase (CMP-KDO synthetase)